MVFYTQPFQVRGYECDIYEHVNNANYLRYLQETVLSALESAGCGKAWLKSNNRYWWMGNIDFEYLQPLRYHDDFDVICQPTQANGSHIGFSFEYIKHGTGERIARATTILQLQEIGTHRSVVIHQDLLTGFFPEGVRTLPANALSFPPTPPPPPGIFRIHGYVTWRDVNADREVDPATLLNFTEDCAWQVIAAHHWPMERMAEESMAILLRRNQLHYIEPARLDDEYEVSTWASNIKRASATRYYEIHRVADHVLLAQIHSLGVWVNIKTGLPMRVPQNFLEDFAPNLVP